MFKKIISIFLIPITLFCLVGWKETPSTIVTVDIPKKAALDEPIHCRIGIGRSYGSSYDNLIESVFTILGDGILFNGNKDSYSETYDLSKDYFRCTKDGNPVNFINITLNFSELQNTEGTIYVELISYFEDGGSTIGGDEIYYKVKNNKIYFSSLSDQRKITLQEIMWNLPEILKSIFVVWLVIVSIKIIACVVIVIYRRKKEKFKS